MSIPVSLDKLAETLPRYPYAYLLTVDDASRSHVVAVVPTLRDGQLRIGGLGNRSRANAAARPGVSLVWPPAEAGGYSLIVDGDALVAADEVAIAPTRAVLHRPASASPAAEPADEAASGCASDCVELVDGASA